MEQIQTLQETLSNDLHLRLRQNLREAKLQKEIHKLLSLCEEKATSLVAKELAIAQGLTTLSQLRLKAQILEQNDLALTNAQDNLKQKEADLKEEMQAKDTESKQKEFELLKKQLEIKELEGDIKAKLDEIERWQFIKSQLNGRKDYLRGRFLLGEIHNYFELCAIQQARLNCKLLVVFNQIAYARALRIKHFKDEHKKPLEQEIQRLKQEILALLLKEREIKSEIFTLLAQREDFIEYIAQLKAKIEAQEKELEPQRQTLAALNKELADALEAKEAFCEQIATLKERLITTRAQIQAAQKEKLELNDTFYKLYGKICLKQGELESICAQSARLKAEIKTA